MSNDFAAARPAFSPVAPPPPALCLSSSSEYYIIEKEGRFDSHLYIRYMNGAMDPQRATWVSGIMRSAAAFHDDPRSSMIASGSCT